MYRDIDRKREGYADILTERNNEPTDGLNQNSWIQQQKTSIQTDRQTDRQTNLL